MADTPLRVMLVDDHEVVREGIRALLDRREGMRVVAEAGTVAQAVEVALREKPDVIVMDVRLPDGTGVEACRDIRAELPETKTLMLTSYADEEAVMASILAGASAYLLKQTRGQQLAEAVEAVARGESLLDPMVTMRVLEQVRGIANGTGVDKQAQLNENETKILRLIAEGKTNKEIAAEVFLSDKTVKNYVSSILSKLNLRRRSEAAAYIARKSATSE
jgi:DNA-binding NarL/FixJ family response regulator